MPMQDVSTQITFLFLGGISSENAIGHGRNFKGIVTLLDAWEIALSDLDNQSIKIKLLIGGPRTDNSDYLNNRLENSKIESSVQIIGELNQDEIKAYINKATVVIIPSMAEGLPNLAM